MKTFVVIQHVEVNGTIQRYSRDSDRIFAEDWEDAEEQFRKRFKRSEGYILWGQSVEDIPHPTILDSLN